METPKSLPTELTELLQSSARLSAMPEVVDCITCLTTDPPEGAVISRPIIQACRGLDRKKIVRALEALEEVEVIERYTPDPATSHRIRQPGRTACFKLTELGGEIFPQTSQAQCNLRDPLTAHTPEQKKLVDCARCIASREDPAGQVPLGAFTLRQVALCQGLPLSAVRFAVSVTLVRPGLVERERCQPVPWQDGPLPQAYAPTEKGRPWLTPIVAPTCPTPAGQQPEITFSDIQQAILDCIATLYSASVLDESAPPIHPSTIMERTGAKQSSVREMIKQFIRSGYIAPPPPVPNGHKIERYELTEAGVGFLSKYSNRLLLPEQQDDLGEAFLDTGLTRDPNVALTSFQQHRGILIKHAQEALSRAGLATFWAEDITNEAFLKAYKRYVVKGVPIETDVHLVNVFRAMVSGATVDFIRKESGTRKIGTKTKIEPLSYDDTDERTLLRREMRIEKAMRRATSAPITLDEEAIQRVEPQLIDGSPAFSDRLLTTLAQMMLVMDTDERQAVFARYSADVGDTHLSLQEWNEAKPHLISGRTKVVKAIVEKLRDESQPRGVSAGKVRKSDAPEIVKQHIMSRLKENDPSIPDTPDKRLTANLEAMRAVILRFLYPSLASLTDIEK